MRTAQLPFAWSLALTIPFLLTIGKNAGAGPYYNVTTIESYDPVPAKDSALYPPSSFITLTAAQLKELPGEEGYYGVSYPVATYFTMKVAAANASGTVLGGLPDGSYRSSPYEALTIGYTQMQPDGHFGPFVALFDSDGHAQAYLSSQNKILVRVDNPPSAEIIDLNNGTKTDFSSILSPAVVQKYAYLFPFGIAANGTILVESETYGWERSYLLLSPPDVPLPVSTPEPTALLTLSIGLGVLAFRRHLRRVADGSLANPGP